VTTPPGASKSSRRIGQARLPGLPAYRRQLPPCRPRPSARPALGLLRPHHRQGRAARPTVSPRLRSPFTTAGLTEASAWNRPTAPNTWPLPGRTRAPASFPPHPRWSPSSLRLCCNCKGPRRRRISWLRDRRTELLRPRGSVAAAVWSRPAVNRDLAASKHPLHIPRAHICA
jgi:hypothetical protein